MGDRVLLSASRTNAEDCIRLAVRHGLGVELMAFAYPDVLDGDWRAEVERYRALIKPVTGMLTLHGPFLDMSPASPDSQINEVCRGRFRHALRIAHELGGKIVILHANFIAAIRTESYRTGWHARSVTFWADIAEYAQQLGVTVAIENMWEFEPDIIGDVLREIDHPYLRACIDIGHAHLYSEVPFTRWLDTLKPYLVHLHVNNNDGSMDFHGGLAGGFLDYPRLLGMVRDLPNPPSITMEMDRVADMEASLSYFQLPPVSAASE